jgi:hypothetical protein
LYNPTMHKAFSSNSSTPKKVNPQLDLPYAVSPYLGIYPKESNSSHNRDTWPPLFTMATHELLD